MRHIYSIARFVPDPARGEAINLGILAGSDESGEWSLRTVSNYSRARRLDDRDLLPSVRARLERLESLVERFTDQQGYLIPPETSLNISENWLTVLSQESANILQFTRPLPTVAESAEEAIDDLWDELIVEATSRKFRFEKKHRAIAAVNRALRSVKVPEKNVVRRAEIKSAAFHSSIDFAVRNGRVAHLTNCWSFQLPDKEGLLEEVTSWSWTVRDFRKNGGIVVDGGRPIEIREDARIFVVYVGPRPGVDEDERAFQSAKAAFEDTDVDVKAVPADKAASVAEEAARQLGI